MEEPVSDSKSAKNSVVALRLDLRWIVIGLLVVIAVMLALWRPWQHVGNDKTRTISVTGTATVKAEPDEYIFNPNYEFTNVDKKTALSALTAKQNEIVDGLKKIGVASSKIKTNASGYNYDYYYSDTDNTYHYTLTLTATAGDKKLAQKVQDYLVATDPTGSVTPSTQFSDTMQKSLESQARDKATRDARDKADRSAQNLGFKVGSVKSVSDTGFAGGGGCGSGFVCPMLATGSAMSVEDSSAKSLTVQPGEDDLSYSVSVVYYVR